MKTISLILSVIIFIGCSSKTKTGTEAGTETMLHADSLGLSHTAELLNDTLFYITTESGLRDFRWQMDVKFNVKSDIKRIAHWDAVAHVVQIKLNRTDGGREYFSEYNALQYPDELEELSNCIVTVLDDDGSELATKEVYLIHKGAEPEPR
jgi:hypothetical protein